MAPTKIYPYSTPEGIRELVPLEDYEALKKAYDNQVKIKAALTQRPDLGDRAPRVQKLIEENAAMREAIREAHETLKDLESLMRESQGLAGYHLNGDVAEWDSLDFNIMPALAKLQPYTTHDTDT
jgi:hypothetical protein